MAPRYLAIIAPVAENWFSPNKLVRVMAVCSQLHCDWLSPCPLDRTPRTHQDGGQSREEFRDTHQLAVWMSQQPAFRRASGLGSNVSCWLGPPHERPELRCRGGSCLALSPSPPDSPPAASEPSATATMDALAVSRGDSLRNYLACQATSMRSSATHRCDRTPISSPTLRRTEFWTTRPSRRGRAPDSTMIIDALEQPRHRAANLCDRFLKR